MFEDLFKLASRYDDNTSYVDSVADVTPEMSSLIHWAQKNFNFDVECNPNYSHLQVN